jgi:Peptidase family U32.
MTWTPDRWRTCSAPRRRNGLNWLCTSTCPCSTWSTACSAPSCRTAPAIRTAAAPVNGTTCSCGTAWGSSIPCWRTPGAGTPCSTAARRREPAFSGVSAIRAFPASAWNCWTILRKKHAFWYPATGNCWTAPALRPGSSGNWTSRNSSAPRKARSGPD